VFDAPGRISASSGMIMISYAGQHHRSVSRRVGIHGTGLCLAAGALLVAFAAAAQDTRTEPQLNAAPPSTVQPPLAPQLPTAPRQPATPLAPTTLAPTALAPTAQAPAAQPFTTQPPTAQPPTAQPPNGNYQPGFIDAFGRFIGESASKLNSQLKSTNETLGNLGSQTTSAAKDAAQGAAQAAAQAALGTAKEAAGVIIGLPSQHIVTGRERCAAAANGAPDCRSAADAACRAKGFAAGKSLDTQSAQKCPARVWLSGRLPADGDCQLETFVTRAVCQ
jgi:hypothetical protein